MALEITEPEAAAKRRGRTRPAADRARRAVAFFGGVWYTSHRCAAMGSETPATKRTDGTIKNFPHPVNGLPRPVVCFTRLRGVVFCEWK